MIFIFSSVKHAELGGLFCILPLPKSFVFTYVFKKVVKYNYKAFGVLRLAAFLKKNRFFTGFSSIKVEIHLFSPPVILTIYLLFFYLTKTFLMIEKVILHHWFVHKCHRTNMAVIYTKKRRVNFLKSVSWEDILIDLVYVVKFWGWDNSHT